MVGGKVPYQRAAFLPAGHAPGARARPAAHPPHEPPPPSPPPRPPFAPPFPWLPIREFIFHIKNSTSPIVTTVLNARLLFSRLSTAPNSTLFFCSCSYGTVASSGRAAAIGTRKGSVFPQLV